MKFEKTKSTQQNAYSAENEDYRYEVSEDLTDEGRDSVTMNVIKKDESGKSLHVGYFSLKKGQKSISFPESEDIRTHLQVFEDFLLGE